MFYDQRIQILSLFNKTKVVLFFLPFSNTLMESGMKVDNIYS